MELCLSAYFPAYFPAYTCQPMHPCKPAHSLLCCCLVPCPPSSCLAAKALEVAEAIEAARQQGVGQEEEGAGVGQGERGGAGPSGSMEGGRAGEQQQQPGGMATAVSRMGVTQVGQPGTTRLGQPGT